MCKKLRLTVLMGLTYSIAAFGQCDYDLREKDVITSESIFQTKPFPLASSVKQKKLYTASAFEGRFEKDAARNKILTVEFNLTNSFGKAMVFLMDQHKLIVRYTDSTLDTLDMVKAPVMYSNSFRAHGIMRYGITDRMIEKFEAGVTVAAMRITSMTFDMDVPEIKTDLARQYNRCWIE